MKKDDFEDRVRQIVARLMAINDLKQKDIADLLQVQQSFVSGALSGSNRFSFFQFALVAAKCGVKVELEQGVLRVLQDV